MKLQTDKILNLVGIIISAIASFFSFLLAIGSFANSAIIAGLIFLCITIFLIRPARAFIEKKIKKTITIKAIISIVSAGLLLGLIFLGIDSDDHKEPSNQVNNNSGTQTVTTVIENNNTQVISNDASDSEEADDDTEQEALAQVLRVVDGDTIEVQMPDGSEETIRLIGIDTPETKDPTKAVECFGEQATDKLVSLIEDKKVYLENDETQDDKDKYNRLLRYVFSIDHENINELMISEGYAYEYTYDVPYKYQKEFKDAQLKAQEEEKGLWSKDTCNGEREEKQQENTSNNATSSSEEASPTTTNTATETSVASPNNTSSGVVKKSNSGICHAPGTTYYARTTNYTAYNSVDECLNSGGRLPKR